MSHQPSGRGGTGVCPGGSPRGVSKGHCGCLLAVYELPDYRTIATLPGPLGDAGLYRVKTDADGVPYLEQVGTVPMLDWDDPEKG
ncbi:MAG: hypothetical protein HRU27_10475 [Rhizobiaceae bacterium]|nr:hypothetical protein [Hyphomicrobiales bacterium]NRB31008.1 hypothetical protein [Rhizobiaceae bacterium]